MGDLLQFLNISEDFGIGFRMDEVMSGNHEFETGFGEPGTRKMEFRVTWGADNLLKYLNPREEKFMTDRLEGTISIDGLCTDAPCTGTMEIKYFSEHKIRYTIDFIVDSKEYQFIGEKVNILPWNLPVSHTTCFGVLTEKASGVLVSKSVTHFHANEAWKFLSSFRLA
jgi:hypothetical protein